MYAATIFFFHRHHRIISGSIIIQTAVNVIISVKERKSLRQVADGVQHQTIPLRPKRKSRFQRQIVHKSLEYITGISRFPRLSDVGDFLWGDAALEIGVTNLKPTRSIGKGDGKVPLAVVGETGFTTFSFRQFCILFLYLASRQTGQEMTAEQSPTVGNSAQKSFACQKKKIPGARAVSVLLSVSRCKVHGR